MFADIIYNMIYWLESDIKNGVLSTVCDTKNKA